MLSHVRGSQACERSARKCDSSRVAITMVDFLSPHNHSDASQDMRLVARLWLILLVDPRRVAGKLSGVGTPRML